MYIYIYIYSGACISLYEDLPGPRRHETRPPGSAFLYRFSWQSLQHDTVSSINMSISISIIMTISSSSSSSSSFNGRFSMPTYSFATSTEPRRHETRPPGFPSRSARRTKIVWETRELATILRRFMSTLKLDDRRACEVADLRFRAELANRRSGVLASSAWPSLPGAVDFLYTALSYVI